MIIRYNRHGSGKNLITFAVRYEQAEAIKVLAQFMNNPNAQFWLGETPIQLAKKLGYGPNHDVIRALEKLQ